MIGLILKLFGGLRVLAEAGEIDESCYNRAFLRFRVKISGRAQMDSNKLRNFLQISQIFPTKVGFLADGSKYRKPEATGEQNVQ